MACDQFESSLGEMDQTREAGTNQVWSHFLTLQSLNGGKVNCGRMLCYELGGT